MLKLNVIANLLGQGWVSLMGLAFVPLYIHYLGIESYGVIGLFVLIQAWLSFLDIPLTTTIAREMSKFSSGESSLKYICDLLRSFELVGILLIVLVSLVVWQGSSFLASGWLQVKSLSVDVVAQAISVMGILIALRICEGVYRGSLFGLQKQVWFNAVNACLATLRHGGAVLILIYVSATVTAFFLWQIIVSVLTLIILSMRVKKVMPPNDFSPKFNYLNLLNVWRFTGGMMSIALLSILLTQADKVILSKMLTLDEFGVYMLAAAVASVLYAMVIPVTQAFYPRLVSHVSRGCQDAMRTDYHLGSQIISVLITPVMLILYVFGEKVIFLWSGDVHLAKQVAPILAPIILGTYLNGLMHMPYQLQLANDWTSLTVKINIIAVFLLLPAIYWVVPYYGAVGAAWIWVSLNIGYLLVTIQLMHVRILPKEKMYWYIKDIFVPCIGGLLVAFSLDKVSVFMEISGRWSWLLFLFLSFIATFFIMSMLASEIRSRINTVVMKYVDKGFV